MKPYCEALAPAHYPQLARFLERHSSGCACQFWHFEGDDYAWQLRCATEPEKNQTALRDSCARDLVQGVVALQATDADDGAPTVVGWLKLCEAEQLHKLTERRVYRTLPALRSPAEGTLRVACMLVGPDAQGQGLAHALLAAAVTQAKAGGAKALEAFPRRSSAPLRPDELWMGPANCYDKLGFEHVEGPEGYPVLRLSLV